MSGNPQNTIDTQYYRIRLYKTFRRSVPAGSDYFAKNKKIFTDLFLSKKNLIDSIIEEEIETENTSLEEFCPKTFNEQENSKVLSTETILTNHNYDMHTIHIELCIVTKDSFSRKVELTIMDRVFSVFNTIEKNT